jgi:ABC-type transport system involved in cytochrome c biogenesis, permease component
MTQPSLRRAFVALLKRDLTLSVRRRAELANPLLFFVIVIRCGKPPALPGDSQRFDRYDGRSISLTLYR